MKKLIQKLIFPINSIQTIKAGFLKGKKIVITQNTQWSPIIGRWEPAMQYIFSKIVKNGDIYYDLGANYGLHGIQCSSLVGETGMVYNFEPLESNIKEIDINYSLNNISNFINVQKAVSNKSGQGSFSVASHASQGSLNGFENKIDIILTTIDDFVELGNPMPNILKMDIEGAEGDCLEGFERNFDNCNPIMIIELHNPEADLKVGKFLKKHNYKAYRFDTFKNIRFEEIKNLELPHPHLDGIWGSILCMPNHLSLQSFGL